MTEKIPLEQKVLSENDRAAAALREQFGRYHLLVLNLVSSPGSGKTSLLERTLAHLKDQMRIAVIVGDVQTENDARRLENAGGRLVRAIVTGGICHLDARMVSAAAESVPLGDLDLLIVENVGNLVCPSSYDLGEDLKVVVMSCTEGDDKPLKYPGMFRRARVMVINKIDLLGLSDFDIAKARLHARQINNDLRLFELSCRTGEGLDSWYDWLRESVRRKKQGHPIM